MEVAALYLQGMARYSGFMMNFEYDAIDKALLLNMCVP